MLTARRRTKTTSEAIFCRPLVWARRQRREGFYKCYIWFKKTGTLGSGCWSFWGSRSERGKGLATFDFGLMLVKTTLNLITVTNQQSPNQQSPINSHLSAVTSQQSLVNSHLSTITYQQSPINSHPSTKTTRTLNKNNTHNQQNQHPKSAVRTLGGLHTSANACVALSFAYKITCVHICVYCVRRLRVCMHACMYVAFVE